MTAQPLRNDNVYPLRMEDAIGVGDVQPENIPPASSTLAGALWINAESDPAKPKKARKPRTKKAKSKNPVGRPKGSKKDAKATAEPIPETQAPVQSLRIAAGGEGMLSRVRRITADQWVWILIPVAALGLALSLAFLTGALKP